MAIREVRTIGDPILEKQSKEVKEITPRIQQLIDDMWETMHDQDGVGLAAVQVGVLKKIFVIETDEEHAYTFINPEILSCEGEVKDHEGCLSVPGKAGYVIRPQKVVVKALDREMKEFTLEAEDLLARAVCHENDHLYGTLYVSKVIGEIVDADEIEEQEEDEA